MRISGAALLAGILASPIGWEHYTLFALPLFFWRPWTALTWLAALLLILPLPTMWLAARLPALPGAILASPGTWALLLLLVDIHGMSLNVTIRPWHPRTIRPAGGTSD